MATFKKYKDNKTGVMLWEWSGYIGVDPVSGKEKVSKKRGFVSKRDAQRDFEKRRHALTQNEFNANDNITVSELFDIYLKYKKDRVKENTLYSQSMKLKRLLSLNIIDENKKLKHVTVLYAQRVYDDITLNYKRSYTEVFRTLNTVFNFAVRNQFIKENPFNKVDKRIKQVETKQDNKVNFLDSHEIKCFIESAKQEKNIQYYYFYSLLLYTGMRQGEARALKWSDVDLFNKTISINKTITRGENGKACIGTTKTNNSTRVINIGDNLIKLLQEWHNIQSSIFFKMGKGFNNENLIFPNQYGNIWNSSAISQGIARVCKRAKIKPITVHGLRHSYVSLMIELGEQPINIAHTVGHSDTKMIMKVYDAMTKNRRVNIADKMNDFIMKIG